jgi:hypothetical protein
VSTFQTLRDDLISWIANEGLAGDKDAAEWVLLNIIGKVYVGFFPSSQRNTRSFGPVNPGRRPFFRHRWQ